MRPLWVVSLLCCLWSAAAWAQQLAFPTAEGFGRFAQGGRGGKAYLINSLSSSAGTGGSCNAGGCSGGTITLHDCLNDRFGVGARTCIFRVGGVIDWPCTSFQCNGSGAWPDNLTIAGQTAPGDGIVIKRFELELRHINNVIIRHLRVYPGADTPSEFYAQHGTIEAFGPSQDTYNIIVDHCSMLWAPDDTLSVSGSAYNITYQWNVIGEGLGASVSDFSKVGILNPDNTTGITLHHNYFPNIWYRGPNIYSGHSQLVNNVYYNNNTAMIVWPHFGPSPQTEFVNNYIRVGPNTQPGEARVQLLGCGYSAESDCDAAAAAQTQLLGNVHTNYKPNAGSGTEDAYLLRVGSPLMSWQTTSVGQGFPTLASQTTAAQAVTDVLARAGARVPTIDAPTQRQFTDWEIGTGRANILDEDTVGGYPTYASGTPYTDTDGDGMSDSWETTWGLDPDDAADGPLIAVNGYSNLENFLNELAGDNIGEPPVDNLSLHLALDEGTGTNADDASNNDHDGTLTNGPTWVSGAVGSGAVRLDGVNDSITVADADHLDAANDFSISVWLRPLTAAGDSRAAVVKNHVYYIYASSQGVCGNGGVQAAFESGVTTHSVCHSTPLTLNDWTHLVLTFDGATLRLYRNAVEVGTPVSTTDDANTSTGTLQIGASQFGENFSGDVDDVRIYTNGLTAAEVATLFALATPPPPPVPGVRMSTGVLRNAKIR